VKTFDDAFDALMGTEGGYTVDNGGPTMWGVTERVARAWGYKGDMQDLPRETAKLIAKQKYWDPYQCDQFDARIAFQVFDAAYNGGRPAVWLQNAVGVTPDNVIGAKTIAAARAADPYRTVCLMTAQRIRYLTSLAVWPTYGKGWANRMATNLELGAQ
jgi:lysozyme family protein